MVVRSSGNNLNASVHQSFAKSLRIVYDVLLIGLKLIRQRFLEAHCLCCDHMHQRAPLYSGENSLIKVILVCCLLICKDHTASGAAQRLMGRGGHYICIGDRAWMKSCCHKTCNMCHIYHQYRSYFVCHFPEFLKVNGSGIGRCSCNDHLGLTFQCNLPELIIINEAVIVDAIRNNLKILAGNVYRASMSKMAAMIQVHSHDGIAGI